MRRGRLGAWSMALAGWILLAVPAGAEVGVAAILTGRREGTTGAPSPRHMPSRVTILRTVRQDASRVPGVAKWNADGTCGVTTDKVARVAVDDPTVTVEFITPETPHVALKRVKPTVLEGTHVTTAGRPSA